VTRSTPLLLQFDPAMPKRVRSALVGGLSCAVRIGDTLWTACDETCHVERLQPLPSERRTAACVRNSAKGSRLTHLLARDAHFGPFVALPGKENGLDCEGLAVGAGGRVFVGLCGPVLDGWAGVIELRVATDPKDPTELSLQPIPGRGRTRLLVVYERTAKHRQRGPAAVVADLYAL
jgi:hypothetical protein